MDTKTVRLNVTLPEDLVLALNAHAGPRKKSQYIANAIRRQIEQDRKEALDRALEEGYRNTAREGLAISREFEAADLEGWDDY
jgi:metal-responsive CopG/Arc/MetJ family transcriptional regulator